MTNMALALPEIFLAFMSLLLLVYGAWRGSRRLAATLTLAIPVLVATIGIVGLSPESGFAFNGLFLTDLFSRFVKIVLLVLAVASLLMARASSEKMLFAQPEYPVLVLLAVLGMMLMVSANDLIVLYAGLELQSLPLYVLASFRRNDARSSEAGLKYFVLGALASGILLYGLSLLYGAAGSTHFSVLARGAGGKSLEAGMLIGLAFMGAGLLFKIAAVPFHMWAPDVYEGAPMPVTAFFAAVPKLAAMALIARVLMQPFGSLIQVWRPAVVFVAVASMLLGSLAGLAQTNVKRLMAYSAIAQMGTALVALTAGPAGVGPLLAYLVIYGAGVAGVFGVILSMRRDGVLVETVEDFAGLAKTHPLLAAAMAAFLFSLAGVPPLAGFFGKYVVFLAAVRAGMVPLAIAGVIASVIAAGYYLRIVKVMYFDDVAGVPIDPAPRGALCGVVGLAALAVLLFAFYPSPLMTTVAAAARSLLAA